MDLPGQATWLLPQATEDFTAGCSAGFVIPTPAAQPVVWLLFLAPEATFSYMLWVMRNDHKSFSMAHICPWDYKNLEYDGLCSHCCLYEGIVGNFELSAEELEELEELAAQMAKIRAEKRTIIHSNYHHRQMELNYHEYRENSLGRNRQRRERDPEGVRKWERDNRADHKVKKIYYCDICKISCQSKSDLDIHNKSTKHLRQKANLKKPHKCLPCAYGTDKSSSVKDHLKSQRHQRNVAAQSSSMLD